MLDLELHIESEVYLQVGSQCAGGYGQNPGLLLCVHTGDDDPGQLPGREPSLERVHCNGDQYGTEYIDRVSV